MSNDVASSTRRFLVALARKAPVIGRALRERDHLRAENATLTVARDRAEEARWQAVREREQAEAALGLYKQEAAQKALRASATIGDSHKSNVSTGEIQPGSTADTSLAKQPPIGWSNQHPIDPSAMKISVLLPNYNHGMFIKGNIDAVMAQTYPNWELVIVDDGSTDDSAEKIRSLAALDRRIVPIFLPHNRGVLTAIQTGLAATTGTLIYGSAADDQIANERFFELVVAALTQYPEASGAFGKAKVIDAASDKELWQMGSAPLQGFITPQLALQGFLTGSLFVPGAAAIWKRAHFDALGGFDPSLGPQTDYFINHALPAVFGAVFIDDTFAAVRTGATSYHRSASQAEFFQRHALVERKLRTLDFPTPPNPQLLHIWRERLINSHLAISRQRAFFASVRAALQIEPWEQSSLPPRFVECATRLLADVSELERDLADRVSSAHRAFDAVAGSLPAETKDGTTTPS